jgi:integrase/recombinase XerD
MGFTEFTREREYLHNVSPATLDWYDTSFRWLPTDSPSQVQLNEMVIRMREKGLKATVICR